MALGGDGWVCLSGWNPGNNLRLKVGTDRHDVKGERSVLVRSGMFKKFNRSLGHDIRGVGPGHVIGRVPVLLVGGIIKHVDIRLDQDCIGHGQSVSMTEPANIVIPGNRREKFNLKHSQCVWFQAAGYGSL